MGLNFTYLYNTEDSITQDNYDMLIQQIDKMFMFRDKLTYSKYYDKILKFKTSEELIKYYFEPEPNGFKCLNYNELQEQLNKTNDINKQNITKDEISNIQRQQANDSVNMTIQGKTSTFKIMNKR